MCKAMKYLTSSGKIRYYTPKSCGGGSGVLHLAYYDLLRHKHSQLLDEGEIVRELLEEYSEDTHRSDSRGLISATEKDMELFTTFNRQNRLALVNKLKTLITQRLSEADNGI